MARQKDQKRHRKVTAEEKEKRHQAFLEREYHFGESVKALSPDFDDESPLKMKKPTLRKPVISKRLWPDNPSLKKKKSTSSRRGKFGKLPLCIGGAENIDGNSPSRALGVRVKKTFQDEDTGKPRLFYGIVTAHIAKHRLYKVSYEDGDEEEVTPSELEEILASKFNDAVSGGGTKKRKRPKARKSHSVLEIV